MPLIIATTGRTAGALAGRQKCRNSVGILRDNKTREISRLNGIYASLLEGSNVKLYKGRAHIEDKNTVTVNGESITAKYLLIATGGPFVPEFPGNDLVLTSNEIFDLPKFPRRVLVVGGGLYCSQFASIFAGLGSDTTLSYRGEIPLKNFDKDVRDKLFQECQRHIHMQMESNVSEINENDSGLLVTFCRRHKLEVDCVLYATGRKPNTARLGLKNTAVELNPDGTIVVNEHFETTDPGIYALGDVVGRLALTPVATAEGIVLASNLFNGTSKL